MRLHIMPVLTLGIIFLLTLLTVFTGCNVCTAGSGNVTSESRVVETFDGVSLSGRGNLYVTQSSNESVRIEAEDNILPHIRTSVRDGELIIDMDNRCIRPTMPIKVYVSADRLKALGISGMGDIAGQTPIVADSLDVTISGAGNANLTVNAQRLATAVSGSGDISYAGSVQEHDIAISGRGGIDAFSLATQETSVAISGAGDAHVFAAQRLDVRISGSGDVAYRGSPQVSQSISGRGSIRQQNTT